MTIEVYTEQRGQKPFRVTLLERPDKGLTVWMRWYAGGRPRYQMTEVRTLRDARGRILKRNVERAQAEADAKIDELQGRTPSVALERAGPLSLAAGVQLAFSARGPYPHDPDRDLWTRAAQGYAADALRLLSMADDRHRPGDELNWEEITPGMIRAVWRLVERESRGKGSGRNTAEKILVVFFRIAGWLQGEYPDQRFPAPLKGWRQELRAHWKKRGHAAVPEQPRHSPEEIAALYAHRGKGDPRIRLALAIGGRLRGGQVIRTLRSHYDPDRGIPIRRGHLGQIDVPYVSEKKKAPRLYLNWRERLELERAMRRGYLAELEAAYRRGLLKDYPLFPGGRLREGRASLRPKLRPMSASSIADLLHDLEREAGVEPVPGRGWHGLRRGFTDLDETASGDERVKERLGGWTPGSSMRKRIYQQQESVQVDTEAARARGRSRPGRGE